MAIPESVVEDIKAKNDIADVVSAYVTLKRAGANMNGLCPFHNEKTPSFTVFNATQTYHCFGCGAGGDVVTFVRRIENLDYVEALRFLAKRVGIAIPEDGRKTGDVSRSRILELNRAAARFFFDSLKGSPEALGYFSKRQLSAETVRHFGLGYAPGYKSLYNAMRAKGFTDSELLASKLFGKNERGMFSYFRNRVMFPILDTSGSVIAFGGRVLDNSEPKYLNSPDTAVFKKSRNLFALNFARNAVKERELILCEGYMDVIALHAAGFENAVATLGTALTQEQARLMKRYADTVILSYDSDRAGRMAAERALGIFSEVGMEVRVLQTENAKDPDEFIKKFGADAFRKLIDRSASSFDFRIRNILSRYDITSPDAKLSAAKEICREAAKTDSSVERELYILRASEKLGISADSLKHEVKTELSKRNSADRKNYIAQMEKLQNGVGDRINPERSANPMAASAEEAILGILLTYPERVTELDRVGGLREEDFVTAFDRRVFTALLRICSEGNRDVSLLGEEFSAEEMGRIYQFRLRREGLDSDVEASLADNISALKRAGAATVSELGELIEAKRRTDRG